MAQLKKPETEMKRKMKNKEWTNKCIAISIRFWLNFGQFDHFQNPTILRFSQKKTDKPVY